MIDELLDNMSIHCNLELYEAAGRDMQEFGSLSESYYKKADEAERCITELYNELNLKP